MAKELFGFILPKFDNAGRPLASERAQFCTSALHLCGGYTWLGLTKGVWRDPDTGRDYEDDGFLVWVNGERADAQLLFDVAGKLFSDQVTLQVFKIGTGAALQKGASLNEL